eukprot:2254475-Pyramimonas_sp.AAC.1
MPLGSAAWLCLPPSAKLGRKLGRERARCRVVGAAITLAPTRQIQPANFARLRRSSSTTKRGLPLAGGKRANAPLRVHIRQPFLERQACCGQRRAE